MDPRLMISAHVFDVISEVWWEDALHVKLEYKGRRTELIYSLISMPETPDYMLVTTFVENGMSLTHIFILRECDPCSPQCNFWAKIWVTYQNNRFLNQMGREHCSASLLN